MYGLLVPIGRDGDIMSAGSNVDSCGIEMDGIEAGSGLLAITLAHERLLVAKLIRIKTLTRGVLFIVLS